MDKAKAMERLDAIESEAKELRKIIERPDKVKFNEKCLYVGLNAYGPYIMAGERGEHYRFQKYQNLPTESGWGRGYETGQECLDAAIKDGIDIHEFTDTREAFKFFLDNYKG